MKIKFLNLLFIIFLLTSCKQEIAKTPEELRLELWSQESSKPNDYLELNTVTLERNKIKEESFFSSAKYDGSLLKGKIKNSASIASFKDVVITIEFYSKTNTLLQSKQFVQYEFFEPNSIKEFIIKVYPPEETSTYNAVISGAYSV